MRGVSVDTVPATTPEGQPYDHTRVTPPSPLGAVIVPVCRLRGMLHVCLVRQYRPVPATESLELPRGSTSDLSEDEAARELVEETGVGQPREMQLLSIMHPDTGLLTTTVGVWAARVTQADMDRSLGYVELSTGVRPEWMFYADALGLAANGAITCGMTLAALALMRRCEHTLGQ